MWVLLLMGVIICSSMPTEALKCYSCIHVELGPDPECMANPEDVTPNPIIECNKRYCFSKRTEYIETKDTVQSISRTCVDDFPFKNDVQDDPYYRTHFIACETDLCNGGNGRVADTNRDPDDGDEVLLLVLGVQNGNMLKVSYYLIYLILLPSIFKFIALFI